MHIVSVFFTNPWPFLSFFFLKIYLFIGEKVCMCKRGQRERENLKQTLTEHGALCGTQSHDPEIMT